MIGLWTLLACSSPAPPAPAADGGVADTENGDSGHIDAGLGDTGAADSDVEPEPEPYCEPTADGLRCSHEHTVVEAAGLKRDVLFQTPHGSAPAAGWPWVMVFQGSFVAPIFFWEADIDDAFGAIHQVESTNALLNAGFAVVTPTALAETFWQTNVAPYNVLWETSADHAYMEALFEAVEAGEFGPLDVGQAFASGLSSGGMMTSRMAVSYPGRFCALAIHAGTYATCAGSLCWVPSTLPSDHPPTHFFRGDNDLIVPGWTVMAYYDGLVEQGTTAEMTTEANIGHAWLASAVDRQVAWFEGHSCNL